MIFGFLSLTFSEARHAAETLSIQYIKENILSRYFDDPEYMSTALPNQKESLILYQWLL